MTATKDELFDAVTNMTDQMSTLNRDMLSASNTLTSNLRSINDQINVVSNLLLDAVEEISDPGSKNIFEDESENLTAQNEGKVEGCTNRGTVEADMNVGGIAGTMAVENTLDPEDDDKDENRSLLRTEYTISAVVMNCVNEGTVTSKKEAAGGICGEMDLGYITGCEAYGKVDGNNKVGGIAGRSSAKLISNWAKCELTGSKYIGGIVGQGADSVLTGNSCIIKDNRAMVDIHEPDDDGMTPKWPSPRAAATPTVSIGAPFPAARMVRSRGTCLSPIPCAALTVSAVPVRQSPLITIPCGHWRARPRASRS